MDALLGLTQVVLRAAVDDVVAVLDEVMDQVTQVQQLGATLSVLGALLDQRDIVDAEGALQRRHLIELVEDDARVGIALDVDDDAYALAVRLVGNPRDAIQLLVIDQIGDTLDELGLIDLVGDLGDDDALMIVVHLDLAAAADDDAATAGLEGLTDPSIAVDEASRREVGGLDVVH